MVSPCLEKPALKKDQKNLLQKQKSSCIASDFRRHFNCPIEDHLSGFEDPLLAGFSMAASKFLLIG